MRLTRRGKQILMVSIVGVLAVTGGGALFYINNQENLGATDSSADYTPGDFPTGPCDPGGSDYNQCGKCGIVCDNDEDDEEEVDDTADLIAAAKRECEANCGSYGVGGCVSTGKIKFAEGCHTEPEICALDGNYWYNNTCNSTPESSGGGGGSFTNSDCTPGVAANGVKCFEEDGKIWDCPGNRCRGPEPGSCVMCNGGDDTNDSTPVCGNRKVESGESCDDGNTNNGDGCNSTCQTEAGGCAADVKECPDGSAVSRDPANNCEFPVCPQGSTCGNNIVETGEECDGNTCEFGACTSQCTCPGDPNYADFRITKTDRVSLSNDGSYFNVTYTIALVNAGGASGTVTRVVDTVDSNMQSAWFVPTSVSPTTGFAKTNNVLTWTLTGDLAEFTAGEQVNFQYSFNIPASYKGNYTNHVTAYVSTLGVDNVSATNIAYVGGSVPNGGLFDTFISRVIAGSLLITFAGIAYYSDKVDTSIVHVFGYGARLRKRSIKIEKRKSKFEKKIK